MKLKLVALNARYTHSCLALFYIRQEIEHHCSELDHEIMQCTINDPYYELLLRLVDGRPDYLFFSALIWNSELIERLLSDIGSAYPEIHCVVGGPQAGVIGERYSSSDSLTIVTGEIEAVGAGFWQDIVHKRPEKAYGGNFLQLPSKSLSLPYRQEDFAEHLNNRHIYYESSRGCPFACSYCLSAAERGVFHKPVEQVCEEIDFFLAHKPLVIRFVDRTFNDMPERARAIWRHIASKECDTTFHFEISPDRFTPECLAFLATVPDQRFQFEIGIQSTNPATLQAINRFVDTQIAHEAVTKLAAAANIHLHLDLILGLPFEDELSFAQSFRDVFAMGGHYIQMGLLKILPDTPLSRQKAEYGYLASGSPPYSIFCSNWMPRETLSRCYWFCECVEKFLNNRYFSSLWQYLRKTREDIYRFFENILARCFEINFFDYAATHERMGEVLINCIRARDDAALLEELLCYDWLRCGHRYLPTFLQEEFVHEHDHASLQEMKKQLFHDLDDEIEGLYTAAEKSKFFKKALFMRFSGDCLSSLGYQSNQGSGLLCFLHERETKVHSFCKSVLIAG